MSVWKKPLILALLFVLYFNSESRAQVTWGGCTDYKGFPVASIPTNVNNVAVAYQDFMGRPIIAYNRNVLNKFSPITRLFWYFHECAHHRLGHSLFNIPLTREKDADCWAIVAMQKEGLLTEAKLKVIKKDISNLPGDGWVYLPGPERAVALENCLEDAGFDLYDTINFPRSADICNKINLTAQQSKDNFDSWKGNFDADDERYRSKYEFPGATECWIRHWSYDNSFVCHWGLQTDIDLGELYELLDEQIESCSIDGMYPKKRSKTYYYEKEKYDDKYNISLYNTREDKNYVTMIISIRKD